MSAAATPNVSCAQCKRTGGDFFHVSRRKTDGTETSAADLCSLLCMLQWTQQQCIQHGVRLVTGVQTGVQRIKQFLKGG